MAPRPDDDMQLVWPMLALIVCMMSLLPMLAKAHVEARAIAQERMEQTQ